MFHNISNSSPTHEKQHFSGWHHHGNWLNCLLILFLALVTKDILLIFYVISKIVYNGLCEYACCYSLKILDDFCDNRLVLSSDPFLCISNSRFYSFTHEWNHHLLNILHPYPQPYTYILVYQKPQVFFPIVLHTITNLSLQFFSGSKPHRLIANYFKKYFPLHTVHTHRALEYSWQ